MHRDKPLPRSDIGSTEVPPASDCVLRELIERRAADRPDKVYVRFADGSTWTYREMRRQAVATARRLQALGVRQGDTVNVWLPNGPDMLRVWFGINLLGAVFAPINLAYRGGLLEHVVHNGRATLIVGHAELLPRLGDIDCAQLRTAVAMAGEPPSLPSLAVRPAACLDIDDAAADDDTLPALERPIEPWDTMEIIYTSGTTGPSKGVVRTYVHVWASCHDAHGYLSGDDRLLVNLPIFHASGTMPAYNMILKGGSIALVDSFKTSEFWETVRATQCTATNLLGAMASFLVKQPPMAGERDHGLRIVSMVPLCEDAPAFTARFGCDIYTVFNMTEISVPLVSELNPRSLGSCGRPRPGIDARLVDDHDREVAPGEVGELILRADRPWAMSTAYHGDATATANAWRNGWFHTGDAFRVGPDGDYYFTDRKKDAIRRRGENISSFEVEAEVLAHPAVREAAAIGVRSEHAEDELLVAVALVEGAAWDPVDVIAFLRKRMAHFMVPRYLRVLPMLPKTPTQKVQKHVLREQGITADTWDREQHGIRVKREVLSGSGANRHA